MFSVHKHMKMLDCCRRGSRGGRPAMVVRQTVGFIKRLSGWTRSPSFHSANKNKNLANVCHNHKEPGSLQSKHDHTQPRSPNWLHIKMDGKVGLIWYITAETWYLIEIIQNEWINDMSWRIMGVLPECQHHTSVSSPWHGSSSAAESVSFFHSSFHRCLLILQKTTNIKMIFLWQHVSETRELRNNVRSPVNRGNHLSECRFFYLKMTPWTRGPVGGSLFTNCSCHLYRDSAQCESVCVT